MRMMSDPDDHPRARIWTISNLLSMSRIVLAFPIVLLLLHRTFHSRLLAVLVMLAAVGTDFLDGYVARQRNEITDLGKILDPLADKICVGAVTFVLCIAQYLPVWFFGVILARDLLILAGGIWLMRSMKVVLQSNWLGKWAVSAIAVTIIAATARIEIVLEICMGISCVLLLWSFLSYTRRFIISVRK